MRYAQRRDANEPLLIELAESLGAWCICHPPLDWWVCFRGVWTPLEIKDRGGRYTPAQKSFLAYCEANRAPVWTWRTTEDVLLALNPPPSPKPHPHG